MSLEEDLSPGKVIGLTRQSMVRKVGEESAEQQQKDCYETHRHRVFSISLYMTGNEMEAERLLTETFVRCFRQTNSPDACVVDNALVHELRATLPLAEPTLGAEFGSPGALPTHRVKRHEMEAAVLELPPMERLLFLLRDVEGYSVERIGALLQVPERKVKFGLLTARLKLRQVLAARAQAAAEDESEQSAA